MGIINKSLLHNGKTLLGHPSGHNKLGENAYGELKGVINLVNRQYMKTNKMFETKNSFIKHYVLHLQNILVITKTLNYKRIKAELSYFLFLSIKERASLKSSKET